jgi:hypothetical protein
MPKLIIIEEIEEDMVLASPVRNKMGQILLGADMLLQEKHKKILKTWGIEYISIKNDGNNEWDTEYSFDQVDDAKILLFERLSWTPGNSYDKEIYDIALNKILVNNFKPPREKN